jgi:hypothetical protein
MSAECARHRAMSVSAGTSSAGHAWRQADRRPGRGARPQPRATRREYKVLAGVVGTESSGQDLLGGGGASIVRYLHESINGSQAHIRAAVKQWSRIGYVNPKSGKQHWQVNHAIVLVNVALVRSQRGNWLVASRSWNYAPGQGP